MRPFTRLLILAAAILFAGCSGQGFNRGALKEQLGVASPVMTDVEIGKVMSLKPNLPKPFRLGVYFKDPVPAAYPSRTFTNWRWTDENKAVLMKVADEFKQDGTLTEVFPIANATTQGEDLKSIRLAAARHNADAVLIVSGAGDIDRYTNDLGWTYVLLVTALFVPGSQVDGLFIANASLWDVRNEFLYLTAGAEAQSSEKYIAAFGRNDKEIIADTKHQAIDKLRAQLADSVKGLHRR